MLIEYLKNLKLFMKFQNTNNTFKIVLSVGDESGIGPEIILKALYSNEIPKNIDFILVGSKKNYKIHIKSSDH